MITIKPIDVAAVLEDAANCGAIVTAEEHNIIGGLGGAVAETVTSAYPVPVVRVGVKDTFGESGKPEQLLKKYGLGAIDIVEAAKKAIGLKSAAGLARR
jgi:transketolase